MDLRTLDNESLQKIVLFGEKLVELQNAQIDFNDPDIENAEKQALEYVERRKAGYRNLAISENDEITKGVRDFIRKKSMYRNENQTRDLSITYPEF